LRDTPVPYTAPDRRLSACRDGNLRQGSARPHLLEKETNSGRASAARGTILQIITLNFRSNNANLQGVGGQLQGIF